MQVQQELEHYRADALYFEQHRQELLQQYPEQWIAIYGQEVVATAKRLPQLIKKLEKRGFPRGQVFIEHVSAREDLLTGGERSMQEHQAQLQRFQRDIDYFAAHQQDLVKRYPERWVAIFNERVVGDDPDLEKLLHRLKAQNIPIAKTLVRRVTAKEELFILLYQ